MYKSKKAQPHSALASRGYQCDILFQLEAQKEHTIFHMYESKGIASYEVQRKHFSGDFDLI